MTRKNIVTLLTVLFIVDGIIVGVLVGALSKSAVNGVLVAIGAMLFPLVAIGVVMGITMRAGGWGRLVSAFPQVPPAPGTVGKMAESLTVGAVPMNNAVECAADDDYLHLTPLMSFGRLCPPVSIPWGHVTFPEGEEPKKGLLTGERVHLVAHGVKMWIPARLVARELEVRRAIRLGSPGAGPGNPSAE